MDAAAAEAADADEIEAWDIKAAGGSRSLVEICEEETD